MSSSSSLPSSSGHQSTKGDHEKPRTKSKKGKSKKGKSKQEKKATEGEGDADKETTLLSASQSAEERERRLHLGDVEVVKLCEANGLSDEDFVRK